MADTNLTGIVAGSFIQKSVELAKETADKVKDKANMEPTLPPPTSNENEQIQLNFDDANTCDTEPWVEDLDLSSDSDCGSDLGDNFPPASNLKQTIQSKKFLKDPNLIPGRFSYVEPSTEPGPIDFDPNPGDTDCAN